MVGIVSARAAVEVSAGQSHACARTADGGVYCCGDNAGSQSSADASLTIPVAAAQEVVLPGPASDISAGGNTSCAVVLSRVYCWGSNSVGQAGIGTADAIVRGATLVPGLSRVTSVDCGRLHTCALTDADTIYCWGDATNGRLGNGATGGVSRTPQLVGARMRPP